jgi:hypothetical protein
LEAKQNIPAFCTAHFVPSSRKNKEFACLARMQNIVRQVDEGQKNFANLSGTIFNLAQRCG